VSAIVNSEETRGFMEHWKACDRRAFPAPEVCEENNLLVVRFRELRLSVCLFPYDWGLTLDAFEWCSDEAAANWVPVAYPVYQQDRETIYAQTCEEVAKRLDVRIPW